MPTVQSKDGTAIAYDRTGSGPALILVDGALCFRRGHMIFRQHRIALGSMQRNFSGLCVELDRPRA